MNNHFQYFGKSIYISSRSIHINYLISKYNCVIYKQKMKSTQSRFLVYAFNEKKIHSNILNSSENQITQTEYRSLRFLIKLKNLSNKLYKQIQNKIFIVKKYLCVVYGFQFQYFNQNKKNWYTAKLAKLFLSHASFLIQVTDCFFLTQPLFKDIKHVLNGPTIYIVDSVSLSRLRKNLYEHLFIFFKSVLLMFKTFILQMEEDGEEVLTKIKDTDVFRRQKPGTSSFFKKNLIHYEDDNFSEFRFLKRKTRSFLKIIALFSLPFIIYQINQKIYAEPGLPKLAYIMFNSNKKEMQYMHKNAGNTFTNYKFTRQNFQENIKLKSINELLHSNKSDQIRIIQLLNIKNSWKFTNFDNIYSNTQVLNIIDSILFDQTKMNFDFFLNKSFYADLLKKNIFKNINENHLSEKIIKYAFFLIKPRQVSWNQTNSINDIDHIPVIENINLIKNADILYLKKIKRILNQFSHRMQDIFQKHLYIQYIYEIYNKQLFFVQELNKNLNANRIINLITLLFYQKNETSINTILSTNTLLETNHLDRFNKSNILTVQEKLQILYINKVTSVVQNVLRNYIQTIQYSILNCFNFSLRFCEIPYEGLNTIFTYRNSLINWNDKESFFKKNQLDPNLIFIKPNINNNIIIDFYKKNELPYENFLKKKLYFSSKTPYVSNFDIRGMNRFLFIPLLEWTDKLYLELNNDSNHSIISDINTEINNIILLIYPHIFEKKYVLLKSMQFMHKMRNLNTSSLKETKNSIYFLLFKQEKKIYTLWNQLYKKQIFEFNNTKLSDNKYQNESKFSFKKQYCISLQFVNSLTVKQFSQRWINDFKKNMISSQHDSFNSNNLWYSLTNIFKNYMEVNCLSKLQNNFHISKERSLNEVILKESPHLITNSSQDLKPNVYISNQTEIIKQYIPWLFTSEWWTFVNHANHKIWLIFLQDMYDYIYSSMLLITRYLRQKSNTIFNGMYQNITYHDDLERFNKLQGFHLFFEKKLQNLFSTFPLSIWESGGFSSFRINIWHYGIGIVNLSSLYWFSIVLGGSSLVLWIMFEKIRDLIHISWNTELDILILANLRQNLNPVLSQKNTKRKNKLQEQYYLSLQKWSIWFRLLYSMYFGSKIQAIWIDNTQNSDIYTGQKELASQLLVGETNLSGFTVYNLDHNIKNDFGYQSNKQEGLNYLKQLIQNKYTWYRYSNLNFLNNQRFISFSFYKNHSSSEELWGLDISGIVKKQYLPISLELSELYSRGILLIGPQDTGKSFLVKSLAADANLPFIYIAIDKLIDLLEFEDEMLEGDSSLYFLRENLIRFNTITNFIKLIGSCVIWIPNIETIHDSSHYTSKIKEQCTLLILRYLLQNITAILNNSKHVLVFASCENTSYLDPGFISAKRFNRFVNLRLPNNVRRPQIFAQFLKNKGLEIKSELTWYTEFSNSTMGFTLRDLTVLANEALILSIQAKRKFLTIDDIRLVLYRGLRANQSSRKETSVQMYQRIQYKIGRAIVQTTLVRPNPMIPVRFRYDLWKPRFYFLSKAYLQPDYSQSTVTQLQILSHILNCLAGSAARDAWLLSSKKNLEEDSFYLNTEIEHDLTLAVNLFEAILKEFPYIDICQNQYDNLNFIPQFNRMHNLVSLDQGNDVAKQATDQYQSNLNFSTLKKNTSFDFQDQLENILPDIAWGSRIERLSLSRNVLFDLLKRVDEPLSLFSSVRFFGKTSLTTIFSEKQTSYGGHYHRSWDVMKLQIAKDLDYTFYGMLSKQRIRDMALPITSDQLMEYEPSENQFVFLLGRPIWNPTETLFCNFVFRQRQLLANEELLSILYIMYRTQQSHSLIAIQTRRKELWTPDAYLENISMNKQVQTKIQNFHIFSQFRTLAYANATFQRPQPDIPSNSEISFIKRFIASNRLSRFSFTEDIFYQQNIFKKNDKKIQELLTYGTLLESYHYLLNFFIEKQNLFKKITNILFQKGVLYEEDIKKYF